MLTIGGHRVLMDQFGHVERCVVESAKESRNRSGPRVSYVLGCPSGEFSVTLKGSKPISANEEPSDWNLLIVLVLVPVGLMTGAVFIARAMGRRKQ